MWRNWLRGARDMYLARSADGVSFAKPEKLGTGSWQLNACPMDGGGLVVSDARVVSAWRRDGEIFLASPGEKEVSLGKGVDVAIAPSKGGVYAVWSAPSGVVAFIPAKKATVTLASKGAFPNVVSSARRARVGCVGSRRADRGPADRLTTRSPFVIAVVTGSILVSAEFAYWLRRMGPEIDAWRL